MKPLCLTFIFSLFIYASLAQKGRISGTITDETSDTVMGATVRLFHDDTLVSSAETHYNGYFSFTPQAPGCYKLMIFYGGYRAKLFNDITVAPGFDTLLTVELRPVILKEVIIAYYQPSITGCRIRCGFMSVTYNYDGESPAWFYPNPTTGILNISEELPAGLFYITDMTGKLIRSFQKGQKGKTTLDVSGLSDGMYILTFQAPPDIKLTGKFIVIH